VLGSSPSLSMGPEAATALMAAIAIGLLAAGDPARYAGLATTLAVLVGLMSLAAWLLRLGFVPRLAVTAGAGRLYGGRGADHDRRRPVPRLGHWPVFQPARQQPQRIGEGRHPGLQAVHALFKQGHRRPPGCEPILLIHRFSLTSRHRGSRPPLASAAGTAHRWRPLPGVSWPVRSRPGRLPPPPPHPGPPPPPFPSPRLQPP